MSVVGYLLTIVAAMTHKTDMCGQGPKVMTHKTDMSGQRVKINFSWTD